MRSYQNVSLKSYNSFGVKAKADSLLCFDTDHEVLSYFATTRASCPLQMAIGGGSNLLFSKDYPGVLYKMENKGISLVFEGSTFVDIVVAAGEAWDDVVVYSVENGWGGIENLSLIPGTAGAAAVQNIGAYGVEIAKYILWVEAVDRTNGKKYRFAKKDLHYAYRDSDFKHDKQSFIITNIALRLDKEPQLILHYKGVNDYLQAQQLEPNLRHIRQAIVAIRNSKLPKSEQLGNAGSFFKNPIVKAAQYVALKSQYPNMPSYSLQEGKLYKIPAAWLIQHSGAQKIAFGDAQVYSKHALILVNKGTASGADLLSLSKAVQKKVKEVFDICIEPEVLIL